MAKNTGEYGKIKKQEVQPHSGIYDICPPLWLNSVSCFWGSEKPFPPMVSMYVLPVVNDLYQ
jgi:hypothetical protein